MAKGIEDTAYYRWFRLAASTRSAATRTTWPSTPDEFHAWCERQLATWPTAMTTLSTHDTKRSEDVRARLMVLAEDGEGWARLGRGGGTRRRAAPPTSVDDPDRVPPLADPRRHLADRRDRLDGLPQGRPRGQGAHRWTDADAAYEEAVVAFAGASSPTTPSARHVDGGSVGARAVGAGEHPRPEAARS